MMRSCYPENITISLKYNEKKHSRDIITHRIDSLNHDFNKSIKSVPYFWEVVRVLYLFRYDVHFNLFDTPEDNDNENGTIAGYMTFGKCKDIICYDSLINYWTIYEGEFNNDEIYSNTSLFYLMLDYSGKKKILENFIKMIKRKI
jgi:hypothetical protein